MSDSQWLTAFQAGFHDAALIVWSAFVTVVIAQVHLNPRDVRFVMTEGSAHFAGSPCRQRFMTFNVMVGIDLNLHDSLLAEI